MNLSQNPQKQRFNRRKRRFARFWDRFMLNAAVETGLLEKESAGACKSVLSRISYLVQNFLSAGSQQFPSEFIGTVPGLADVIAL